MSDAFPCGTCGGPVLGYGMVCPGCGYMLRRPPDRTSADLARLRAEVERLDRENTTLRGLLAQGDKDCPYCGLPAADITRCARGFPGCGRMDDIVAADAARAALFAGEPGR